MTGPEVPLKRFKKKGEIVQYDVKQNNVPQKVPASRNNENDTVVTIGQV